jgi:putative ATPase
MILWGPPGTGKTTIARCSPPSSSCIRASSAVFTGVADLKKTFEARRPPPSGGPCSSSRDPSLRNRQRTFLPVMGGTSSRGATPNPSFQLNGASIACAVTVLRRLDDDDLETLPPRTYYGRACAGRASAATCAPWPTATGYI